MNAALRVVPALWLVLAGLWFAPRAGAAEPAVQAPGAPIRALIANPHAVGSGRYTWLGFHVYDAALFAPAGRYAADGDFALELRYAREFRGEAIAERSIAEMRRIGGSGETQLARWGGMLRSLFPDVRPGDRLTGIALATGTAHFFHNGRQIGSIEEPGLVRAFFSIWLDERTSAPALRARLLGLSPAH